MSFDTKYLRPILQKVIDLGEIDLWLRQKAEAVPMATNAPPSKTVHGMDNIGERHFNTYALSIVSSAAISTDDIEGTKGMKDLVRACKKKNVALDIVRVGEGGENPGEVNLEVALDPDRPYAESRVFDRGIKYFENTYGNVVPVSFSAKK